MVVLNKKLLQRKQNDLPINHSYLVVTAAGNLEERKSKLDEGIISGYAVLWTSINDYQERFVKGAFAKSIQEYGPDSKSNYKIKFRDRHGKTCALVSKLVEDDIGLYFETAPMDNVQWAKDMLTQVRSGSINNFSIGFKHVWDRIEWDDEKDCMINLEARLFEISGVDIPSDIETYATRSAEESESTLHDDVEDFIKTLTRSVQLDARILFTRCMSLSKEAPTQERRQSPKNATPTETETDYNSLISKIQKIQFK